MKAQQLYNFTDRFPIPPSQLNQTSNSSPSQSPNYNRQTRFASDRDLTTAPGGASEASSNKIVTQVMNSSEATQIWDKLQLRGCCGLLNATTEWQKTGYPKSCCSNPMEMAENQLRCEGIDSNHSKPCIEVIGSTSLNLLIVLALIALVNLYLATVTGISAYRTFHYNEASQNAYTQEEVSLHSCGPTRTISHYYCRPIGLTTDQIVVVDVRLVLLQRVVCGTSKLANRTGALTIAQTSRQCVCIWYCDLEEFQKNTVLARTS